MPSCEWNKNRIDIHIVDDIVDDDWFDIKILNRESIYTEIDIDMYNVHISTLDKRINISYYVNK